MEQSEGAGPARRRRGRGGRTCDWDLRRRRAAEGARAVLGGGAPRRGGGAEGAGL